MTPRATPSRRSSTRPDTATVPRSARLLTIVESGGEHARAALAALPGTAPATLRSSDHRVRRAPGSRRSPTASSTGSGARASGSRCSRSTPRSPFTGGAILGDRVRMQEHDTDHGVFVRSMATRGHLGGLSTRDAARDRGARRRRVRVGRSSRPSGSGRWRSRSPGAADTTVVVVTPGWGDAIQASKAGLLEVGDVFVVNKADRDGVAATVRDLQGMLDARRGPGAGRRPDRWRRWPPRASGIDERSSAPSTSTGGISRRPASSDNGANCAYRDELRAIGPRAARRARADDIV